ncbi:hypothetical protein [Microbulbifer sp. GL-2]|uniref:hypothetical protein n=1 Tax=Microbulbifer sp. GL-2 TaxID=2591606 RepID=UPI00116595C5|nr:hypothetical protein [Microbulbifer sp. GL-2]BBM00446.1 hypothetical protein GL2_05200 [Microbulbifer sp. GL-2]
MEQTAFDVPPPSSETRITLEQVKVELEHDKAKRELSINFKQKILEKFLSESFFAFVITLVVIAVGISYMYVDTVEKGDIESFWKLILPVITTYLGYAFGKRRQSTS